jgi:phosphoserine phosphatase RsbU/P
MAGSSFAPVNIRNSQILVVDDNRVNRHLLVAAVLNPIDTESRL